MESDSSSLFFTITEDCTLDRDKMSTQEDDIKSFPIKLCHPDTICTDKSEKVYNGNNKINFLDEPLNINSETIIELNESEEDNQKKDIGKNSSAQQRRKKNQIINYNTPFSFFKEEKCKNVDFKEVNLSDYLRILSTYW